MPWDVVNGAALTAVLFAACSSEAALGSTQPQAPVPRAAFEERVDSAIGVILARTGVPSASIAIVRRGSVYAQAYGNAQLIPLRKATPTMRYAVGSISKEFTATALLLLQESGKLSLDDAAGKWIPDLGPASNASIRSLLSHTSGIRDFWPQDYDFPEMLGPTEPQAIVARWANQPLDFPTGTAWQYSNTGYTVAGLIAQRASGEPLFGFLQRRIFTPLAMSSVVDFDAAPLSPTDATGYMRYALGPPRPAAKEGRGWLFAAGELAMTASDLARWDTALMQHQVLTMASARELTTEVRLQNGVGTTYALGLYAVLDSGRWMLKHGGEVGGFTAENRIFPDDGAAIVVLTNEDATDASAVIADAIEELLFAVDSPAEVAALASAQTVFNQLQHGKLNTALLTANAQSYFSTAALHDFQASLGPLGEARHFTLVRAARRGGFSTHVYEADFASRQITIVVRATADGLIEQFTVSAK